MCIRDRARTGASFLNGSGDYAIAFSTGRDDALPNAKMTPLFAAVADATEEAILNALFRATSVGDVAALPIDAVRALLAR